MPKQRGRVPAWPLLCLIPAAAFTLGFEYWPLISTFQLATQGTDMFGRPSGFVGLENFAGLFGQSAYWKTVSVTFTFAAFSVIAKIVVGLLIAIPLSARYRGTAFMRPIILIPMAVSVAVAGLIFKMMYQPRTGLLDQVGGAFGAAPAGWLTNENLALVAVVIVDVWTALGIVTLLLLAALDGVPNEVLEAATIDGASGLRLNLAIRLPLIAPTLYFVVITQTIAAMREFTVINLLTGGGPNNATKTMVIDIYQAAFGSGTNDYGTAAARGLVLLLMIAILYGIQNLIVEKKVHYA